MQPREPRPAPLRPATRQPAVDGNGIALLFARQDTVSKAASASSAATTTTMMTDATTTKKTTTKTTPTPSSPQSHRDPPPPPPGAAAAAESDDEALDPEAGLGCAPGPPRALDAAAAAAAATAGRPPQAPPRDGALLKSLGLGRLGDYSDSDDDQGRTALGKRRRPAPGRPPS